MPLHRSLKLLAVGCTAILALSACNGSSADDKITIGVSFYNETLPVYVGIREGMEAKAKEKNVKLLFSDAENNAATQTDQINNLITRGVDAIIASPADTAALVPAYREAQTAGIPVFSVGNRVNEQQVEAAYIGPDLQLEAEQTMSKLIESIGGKGDILLLTGPPQSAFVQLQKAGWKTALDKAPGVKVVDEQVIADLSKASTVDIASAALVSNKEIDAVLASNDQVGLGAVQAMESLGIGPDKMFVACWNTPAEVLGALKTGAIDLTLTQRPQTWGKTALDTALAWIEGTKPSEHHVKTPDLFVTTKTVTDLGDTDLQ
ncbi:sugar ABC transporter substrate-binding protein [Microtetraspora sp. AC03309]|uniref:sugar ABC transporter substrate-binding protein n=1 Tax=Microtetraspora sp. AC03309 TaxID=2779376 RepID=UPI001E510566|nr:sugar ABC transporter substrate-binding protein [Microtetraspora sp. AC03309]MCC5574650.1 sugar ABC transporter substrate-binding protein [Microtetraspora sp. AC03309]